MGWARLSDADRATLALVAWDGLTGREAARVVGCTRAAFSVRLSRARRRLKRLLGEVDVLPEPSPAQSRSGFVIEGTQP
ncbi:sigma factor-like helix-turn-helix DNA-binding protein [Isoptericola rhizosphaerae]|uniref:sigma factor-like helix-turn-helix DNA-binding protein n=1 Tax=Isoptericola rhizosphaerae TaxID=3377837 RepID=UPI00383AAFF3